MIVVTPRITLDEDEIDLSFVRASGPGGQKVNKTATAVQLRFDVVGSPSLDAPTREALALLAGRRMNSEGILVIDARRHRTQERNRRDALQRLTELIRQAAQPPKTRRRTRPSRAARERRLENKHQRSSVKRHRQRPSEE